MLDSLVPGARIMMADGTYEIDSPLTRKRLRASPGGLPAAFAALKAQDAADDQTRSGVRHWAKRNWDSCLPYYLWSRCIDYADRGDADNSVRAAEMRQVVNNAAPPERMAIRGVRKPLPEPAPLPSVPIGNVLMRRRSVRRYATGQTTQAMLSQFLWHGLHLVRQTRLSADHEDPLDLLLKSYGVAFDFYVASYDIGDLPRGMYYYDLLAHALVDVCELAEGEQEDWFWGMPGPRTSAGSVHFVADFGQWMYRYAHERALRDLYIEAGRIAQRLIISAGHTGLGTLVSPATMDSVVNDRLGVDPARMSVTYTVTFGADPHARTEA